jgi:hypothetical protein
VRYDDYSYTYNDSYSYFWIPLSLDIKYYRRAVTTGNKCIDKLEACTIFKDAVKNYKGELMHSDTIELY